MARKNKKVFEGYNDTFRIEKVSVGFDKLFKTIDKLAEEEVASTWYPPYNIRKTSASDYIIDVELAGYDKKDISARVENGALVITAPGTEIFVDPEGDDIYFHQGIFPGGELYAKFYIADGLEFDSAVYDDGIVSFKFVDVPAEKSSYTIPIGPFEKAEESKPYVPIYDSKGAVVGRKDVDTGVESSFVPEKREEVSVIVNDESSRKPTVEVVALDPMPQIVEVAVENVAEKVDKKSENAQAKIVLKDATYEVVPDDVTTEVVKTEKGKSDIVVAIPDEVQVEMDEKGIDVADAIEKAVAISEVVTPELPPAKKLEDAPPVTVEITPSNSEETVEVVVPEVVSSVVEAKVEDGQVVLSDSSENISSSSDVVPVVTAPGQPDIAVVVSPETQVALDELGVDVVRDISDAVIEAEAVVAPAEVVVPPVFETVDTPIVVNGETTEVPTVEVVLPDPLPQIVEVELESVVDVVDTASEEPQAKIKVKEAVHEVSDDVVTDVVKTKEGKSDVVVAVTEEVHAELAEKGIDVVQAVNEAIVQSELPPPEAPVVEETPVVETKITTESGSEVTVVAPEVIPQVVEATVEIVPTGYDSAGSPTGGETKVVLTDVSTDVPADAELIPVITAPGEHDVMVAVTPETEAALATAGVDVITDLETALVEAETEVVVADTAADETVEPEASVTEVVVNAEVTTTPTVSVTVPDPLPQIVEVTVESIPETVDSASTEPQVNVVVSDATYEVSDNVVTDVIKTAEGQSDVVMAVTEETKTALENVGIDVVEVVKAAVEEAAPVSPELPAAAELVESEMVTVSVTPEPETPKLEVTTPEVIPQVVEAVLTETVDGLPAVELVPASETIPTEAEVIPVVTMEGESDVMVAVSEESKKVLEDAGIDVMADVGKALIDGEVKVKKVEEETPTEVIETIVNADNPEVPTVAVEIPTPLPQIVEVTVDEVPASVDTANAEPQMTLTVSDATYEVSDNVATEVISTSEGQSDVVVAVTEETKASLEAVGVDVMETVLAAAEEAVLAEPSLPAAEPVETLVVSVNEPSTDAPKLEVTTPDVIPQVVEAVMTESITEGVPAVELVNVSEDIPAETELIPVVTMEGQSDVMVAVTPEVKAELEAANVNIMEDVSKALIEAEVEVAKTEEVVSQ